MYKSQAAAVAPPPPPEPEPTLASSESHSNPARLEKVCSFVREERASKRERLACEKWLNKVKIIETHLVTTAGKFEPGVVSLAVLQRLQQAQSLLGGLGWGHERISWQWKGWAHHPSQSEKLDYRFEWTETEEERELFRASEREVDI